MLHEVYVGEYKNVSSLRLAVSERSVLYGRNGSGKTNVLEALALVDHFQFLDNNALGPQPKTKPPAASNQHAAESAGWFLSTSDKWVEPYFNPADLHYVDRRLFA